MADVARTVDDARARELERLHCTIFVDAPRFAARRGSAPFVEAGRVVRAVRWRLAAACFFRIHQRVVLRANCFLFAVVQLPGSYTP